MSFTSYQYGLIYAVWIDYNDNGTLGTTEKVISLLNAASASSINSSFIVPSDAKFGLHRMQVRFSVLSTIIGFLQYGVGINSYYYKSNNV